MVKMPVGETFFSSVFGMLDRPFRVRPGLINGRRRCELELQDVPRPPPDKMARLTITRTFDARARWCGKRGQLRSTFLNWWDRATSGCRCRDGRAVAGRWRHCLRSTETGADLWHGGVFREIAKPARLVSPSRGRGRPARRRDRGEVTFAEQGGGH